jgi:hypothetical protein
MRPGRARLPRTTSRPLAAVLAVALLALAAALVGVAGPAELGTPRLAAIGGPAQRVAVEVQEEAVSAETTPPPEDGLPGWLLVAVWTLAVTGVLVLAARSIRRAPPVEPTHAADPPPDLGAPASRLAGLRDSARAAAADLRSTPVAGAADAVVRSWERLEEAAGALGAARPPAATPTEFTSDLLVRLGAEPGATLRLLELYHRARFSSAPLPADAAAAAAASFESVAASLVAAPSPARGRG